MKPHWTAPLLVTVLSLTGFGFAATEFLDGTRLATSTHAPAPPPYRPHEVIVKLETATAASTGMQSIHDVGGLSARLSRDGAHMLVTLAGGVSVAEAVDRLNHLPGIGYAEPNGIVRAHGTAAALDSRFSPNDRLFFRQWNFKMLDAERAWAIQKGDTSVIVGVLDTGIAYEDFGAFRKAPDWGSTVFVPGFNVLNGSSHANDDNFHGTHVASTIAESTNNGEGVAGLAFNCALMPVKVLNSEGEGSLFDLADGIRYAVHDAPQKAKVLNMSLGGAGDSRILSTALEDAFSAGVVLVASAGNESASRVSFPAAHPRVIAVGAVDVRKRRAPYSNTGSELDVVAPGGDLDRDDDNDGRPDGVLQQTFDPDVAARGRYDSFAYFYVDGTSQASPHVAAVAALLVRQGITSPAAVQAAIQNTAEDLGAAGRDDQFGYGLVRPVEALTGLGLNQ